MVLGGVYEDAFSRSNVSLGVYICEEMGLAKFEMWGWKFTRVCLTLV